MRFSIQHFGAGGSLALLYIEESGVPLPVPGDVYVAYLGRIAAGNPLKWAASWAGIVLVVTAGASNLYLVSRRWGSRLLEHRLAPALHLDAERLQRAEGFFARWGPAAIIFGRHVPGMRIPITVLAGVSRVRYPVFAGSVALSTAVWAALWLWLGARFGPRIGHFLGAHSWAYLVMVAAVALAIAVAVVTGSRRVRDPD